MGRRWAGLTGAERIEAYADLNNLTDDELRQQITETAEELNERADVPDGNVAEILEWVGESRARARAAWRVEREKVDREQRKTLLESLGDLLGETL